MATAKEILINKLPNGTYVYNLNDPTLRDKILKEIANLEKKIQDLKNNV